MPAGSTNAVEQESASASPAAGMLVLHPLSALREGGEGRDAVASRLAAWVRGYLMRPHPDLGRPGAVCPFTSQSAKLDLVRIGVSGARDEDAIADTMAEAIAAFEALPARPSEKAFRTVLVAFPHCGGQEGRATLKRVQNRLRGHSTRKGKMIGLFEPDAPDAGLINPHFRPLRSPVPLLAIRMLVEGDAPFVLRNPKLLPIYLFKFPRTGPGRLARLLWR